MPNYEFHCDVCKSNVEKWTTIADRTKQTCDVCGAPLRQLMGMPIRIWKCNSGH